MKNRLFATAKNKIDDFKYKAEQKAYDNFLKLLAFDDFAQLDKQEKQLAWSWATNPTEENKQLLQQATDKKVDWLKAHGFDPNQLVPQYHCKVCGDTGFVKGQRCECLKREINALARKESGLNNPQCTFEASTETDSHNQQVYLACQKYCDCIDNKKVLNVFLTGQTGTGKTYLCMAMANKLLDAGKTVLAVSSFKLNNDFLQAHTTFGLDKLDIIDFYLQPDVLIIDDLGTEPVYKNVTKEYLFTLLNERLMRLQHTIICTNLSFEQIMDVYDERIFSRLQQNCLKVKLQNKDKRVNLK